MKKITISNILLYISLNILLSIKVICNAFYVLPHPCLPLKRFISTTDTPHSVGYHLPCNTIQTNDQGAPGGSGTA